ncbi:MAG: hypothetical protein GX115_01415 [Ruminiclostridium sp.]|nr:hypothetical protein [Ruminiclostridium sp.]
MADDFLDGLFCSMQRSQQAVGKTQITSFGIEFRVVEGFQKPIGSTGLKLLHCAQDGHIAVIGASEYSDNPKLVNFLNAILAVTI